MVSSARCNKKAESHGSEDGAGPGVEERRAGAGGP